MSWFSSLFGSSKPVAGPAPHEQRILEEPVSSTTLPTPTPAPLESATQSSPTQRTIEKPNRSKIILGAGLGFFAFSLLITRRSFARRRLASQAAFYSDAPGHHIEQSKKVSGAIEALEALNIATINVLSLAMIGTGGAMWYLDINSMDDARKMLRGGLGVDGTGRSEKDAEEEFEEWMASTLARKEVKEQRKRDNR